MDKKMNNWVTGRIKSGGSINLKNIRRRDISIRNNIIIFLFYKKIFFWDNLFSDVQEVIIKIFNNVKK
jgi:hypothetical protein